MFHQHCNVFSGDEKDCSWAFDCACLQGWVHCNSLPGEKSLCQTQTQIADWIFQDGYVCTWARPGRGTGTVGDCEWGILISAPHVAGKKSAPPLRRKDSLASDQPWFDIRVNLHLCMWYTHHVTASDVMSCCDLGNTRRYNERTFVWSLLLEAFRRRNNFGMHARPCWIPPQSKARTNWVSQSIRDLNLSSTTC